MSDLAFDRMNSFGIEPRVLAQGLRGFRGHHAHLCQGFACRKLHVEPLAEFVLVAPDAPHLRARVAIDQKAKTSVGCACSATTRRAGCARAASASAAPMRTSSGWLLCSLRCPRTTVWVEGFKSRFTKSHTIS